MSAHQPYYVILGLDAPPLDRKAVKRAYSKTLKQTRPEDDPEGFMRLRDAHDLALNILAQEAREAEWDTHQITVAAPETIEITSTFADDEDPLTAIESETAYAVGPTPNLEAPAQTKPSLTYEDLLPNGAEPEPVSKTGYAIGPTPTLDAPVIFTEPDTPPEPPLVEELEHLLESPERYNDREQWNALFVQARRLDIDEYVEFEYRLLEFILHFHGYFDPNLPNFDQPEKLPQKFSPSITASLFKTMNWDKVGNRNYHKANQIEWLERRMSLHQNKAAAAVTESVESSRGMNTIWLVLFIIFVVARIAMAFANG